MSAAVTEVVEPSYAMFRVRVAAITEIGVNFRRFTFDGDDLADFAETGLDQRIKLIFPLPGLGLDGMPSGADWYQQWRDLPPDRRNPFRTYTIRRVRRQHRQIEVDIALHGRIGIASAWAVDARIGDELLILGPNGRHPGPHGGIDFVPPGHTDRFLLAGDETALPAIAAILESLPADARGVALVEVGTAADAAAIGAGPAGVDVRVLGREGGEYGCRLIPAVAEAASGLLAGHRPGAEVEDVDIETGLLWESPMDERGRPLQSDTDVYAWLAGEAGVIKTLRRHLVSDLGIDRRSVAFMGYWRQGRTEDNG